MCRWQTQNWTASVIGRWHQVRRRPLSDEQTLSCDWSHWWSSCEESETWREHWWQHVCVFGLEFCREALSVQRKTWAGLTLSCRVVNKTWDKPKVTWSKTHLMSFWFGTKWTKSRPKTGKELKTWTWFSKAGFTWRLLKLIVLICCLSSFFVSIYFQKWPVSGLCLYTCFNPHAMAANPEMEIQPASNNKRKQHIVMNVSSIRLQAYSSAPCCGSFRWTVLIDTDEKKIIIKAVAFWCIFRGEQNNWLFFRLSTK